LPESLKSTAPVQSAEEEYRRLCPDTGVLGAIISTIAITAENKNFQLAFIYYIPFDIPLE
jgi:hypothetical protein